MESAAALSKPLRPYQAEAVQVDEAARRRGAGGCLNVMATGTGKTLCQAAAYGLTDRRVLVLNEKRHLVRQTAAALARYTGEPWDIEMAEQRSGGAEASCRGVVASVQTLVRPGRLDRINPFDFGRVIVDEGHHAGELNTYYSRVLEHFRKNQQAFISLWTATPRPGLGQWAKELGYVYRLRSAVDDAWLVEPKQRYVSLGEISWAEIKRNRYGDYQPDQLAAVMERTELVEKAVTAALELLGGRKALWFCAGVAHCEMVCDSVNNHKGGIAVSCHRGGEGRRWIPRYAPKVARAMFKHGTARHLIGCDMLTEGYDEPSVQAVVVLRPVRLLGYYLQMIGRGTRLHLDADPAVDSTPEERRALIAGSRKPDLMVIDIVGASLEHKDRPADLTDCLSTLPPGKLRDAARARLFKAADGSVLLSDAEIRRRMEGDRRLRACVKAAAVEYNVSEIDLFVERPGQGGVQKKVRTGPDWFFVKHLRNIGLKTDGLTPAAAKKLWALHRPVMAGNVSERQRQILTDCGYDAEDIHPWKAAFLLSLLAMNNWRHLPFPFVKDRLYLRETPEGWRVGVKNDGGRVVLCGPGFYRQIDARRAVCYALNLNPPDDPNGEPDDGTDPRTARSDGPAGPGRAPDLFQDVPAPG